MLKMYLNNTSLKTPPVQVSGYFDIVIGNPPYVESRSDSVTIEQKESYLNQVFFDFGEISSHITRGCDLLIFFFTRSISLLFQHGVSTLIVQNGWLNTEYGTKASKFLLSTLEEINIIDSSFRQFEKNSANINTIIIQFKKKSNIKNVSFNIMNINKGTITSEKKKIFNINDVSLTRDKWGFIMNVHEDIYNIFSKLFENKSQNIYDIGQGINENKSVFIPIEHINKIKQKENIIKAVYKESNFQYNNFKYFLYHSFKNNKDDIAYLKKIGATEFSKGKKIKRKYPSIIMPRGIGETHFAGLLPEKTFSNSYVDIYMLESNRETLLNIWLFCNCSLFFLYREISGRKNLGGGLLKAEASDIKNISLYFPISDEKRIGNILNNIEKPVNLIKQLDTKAQKEIDALVFNYFNIFDKYELVINELKRLFEFRINKAKT